MRKYIYILFSLVMLMGLGACSDDFNWNGIEVGEDEYLISFAVGDPDLVLLSGTRAETVEPVNDITLVIFNGDEMVQDPITIYNDNPNFVAQTTINGNGSIKLKRDKVQDGDWYLIANAATQISNTFKQITRNDGRLSKGDFLKAMSYTDAQFSATNKVMVGHKDGITLTSGTQTIGEIIALQRTFCKISVEVEDDGIPFRLCSARLSRISDTGDLTLSGNDKTLTDDDFSANWIPVPADRTLSFTNNGNTVKYASVGAQIMQYSFPYTPADNASNQEKIMMLVRGYFSKDDFDGVNECFYAIPLPKIEANHYYQIKIKDASEQGATTAEGAERNPNGIIVEFEDKTDKIKNIMTDGTNVLAVQDTVVISTAGTPVNIPVKVRTAGENAPAITLTKKNTSANSDWLHGVDVYTTWTGQKISSADELKNKLYNCLITGSVSANENNGSERAVTYTITLEGTALSRDIVFLQEGNKDIKYVSSTNNDYPIKSLKLVIKRNNVTVQQIDNYLGYINSDVVDVVPATQCAGIQPAQNGGRVRNLGLHAPMPNGGAVYEYTFELRENASITGNKLTYTFSDTDIPEGGTDAYSYVINSDYITITYNNVTYTLDLYHTGFFHNNLYYEVFTQEDDLYWLDRNLGATSAGVGVRTTSGVISGTAWPYVGADAIGDYCGSSPSCPPGWGVPSYGQLRSLTTRAAFGITRRYINGTAYFAPAFQFDAIEDGQPKKISSYFPLGLKKTGSTYDGTEGAGYYLTTTSAGTSGYYKTMQFTGMNVVAQNTNFDNNNAPKYTMSVRCCAGGYNPSTDGTVYKCSVLGYTNVFMYYLNTDGTKTPLTTWPGERIAMAGDLGRYHPFEITPTMNYDMTRLYVIFNTVNDDGELTGSNVSQDDRDKRIGIKFVNNGKYSKLNTAGDERPGQEGNWVTVSADDTNYDGEQFRITGKFNTLKDWPTTVPDTYSFTSKGNGLYEAQVVVTTPGPFIIAQKDAGWTKGNYKEWKHNVHTTDGTKVENNQTYTMYSGKGDDYNWRFDTAGTYTLTLNWKTKTFSVAFAESGETTTVEKFRLKGNFNGMNWGNGYDFTPLGNDKYTVSVDVESGKTGQFVIIQQKPDNTGWSDSEVTEWKCAVEKDGGTALTDGTYTMILNGGDKYNWLFDRAGTYTIEIDWSSTTKKFTVTCPEIQSGHTNGEVCSDFTAGDTYYLSFNGNYKIWMWIEDGNNDFAISTGTYPGNAHNGNVSFTLGNTYNKTNKKLVVRVLDPSDESQLSEKEYAASIFKWSSANNRWEANLGDLVEKGNYTVYWQKYKDSKDMKTFYVVEYTGDKGYSGGNVITPTSTKINNVDYYYVELGEGFTTGKFLIKSEAANTWVDSNATEDFELKSTDNFTNYNCTVVINGHKDNNDNNKYTVTINKGKP